MMATIGGRIPSRQDFTDVVSAEVMRAIPDHGDAQALEEFHNHRPLFQLKDSQPLLFVEYADRVCRGPFARRILGENTLLHDHAYDQLVDRFCNLQNVATRKSRRNRRGSDCRQNFAAIVQAVDAWHAAHRDADDLELEAATARITQERVTAHALFACRDALRTRNPTRSRFQAQTPRGSVTVWMARWLPGGRRREWMDQIGTMVDRKEECPRQDLQTLTDARYGHSRMVSLDEPFAPGMEPTCSSLDWLIEHEVTTRGIAAFVADEKAIRINELLPSIAKLGPDGVRCLVFRLFEATENPLDNHRAIAAEFGLSPASLSRFAPRRWRADDHRPIPPFYDNLCQALASYPPFLEVACKARVWGKIRQTLNERGGDGHA